MANKKSTSANKSNSTKKPAPIKVEKIVDAPNNSKKEVFAIIIGILIVAALVVGSVIYFKGKDDEPLTKNKDKNNDTVDVLVEPEEEVEETKKEKTKVQKVANVTETVVKKECTSCDVIVLETYEPTKVSLNEPDLKYHEKNDLEVVETYYYSDDEDTYIVKVEGTLKATGADMEYTTAINELELSKTFIRENAVTDEELKEPEFQDVKRILDSAKDAGIISVKSEDTEVITHTFVVRIEEKDKVDWSKGVTVNGTTYNESVLNEDEHNNYTYQDEDGINITVGVNEKDLGKDSKNEDIKVDVKYTTGENEVKENTYIIDVEDVKIEYEKETDSAEDPQDPNATLGTNAVTEEAIEDYTEFIDRANTDVLDDLQETLDEMRQEGSI